MAGVAVAWAAGTGTTKTRRGFAAHETTKARHESTKALTVACACLAAAPDLDLLFHDHRTWTHSVGAALLAGLVAALVARWRGWRAVRTGIVCGIAWGTHILLDWLGADPTPPHGIMALWPFSHGWYIAPVAIFDAVSRHYWNLGEFLWGNVVEAGWEVLVLAPILVAIWLVRVKPSARLASEVTGRHHPAQ